MSEELQKEFMLQGLGCANCAARMERDISLLDGVKLVSVDFISKKLRLTFNSKINLLGLVEQMRTIVKNIEPGVELVETGSAPLGQPEKNVIEKAKLIRFGLAMVLFSVAVLENFSFWLEFGFFFTSYLLVGSETIITAGKNIIRGQVFDENFLMSVATMGAFAIGQFPEGVAVMLFYQVGEFFQDAAVNRSRNSIRALLEIRPDYANILVGESTNLVAPDEVKVGDYILIKPGEKIPLDGVVTKGNSMLDMSALTGESLPRDVAAGDEVLSGAINKNGLLTVRVSKLFGESTVSKILDLVQNASGNKAPTENFITKFARYYTPAVVGIAALIATVPLLLLPGAILAEWVNRALVFLVVSCPCALVISIPLGFFGGIGSASKHGILIKGSNFLEALNDVGTVVFDKTGTLTKGVFKVKEIHSLQNSSVDTLLEDAAYAESYSSHPIAVSIREAYGKAINQSLIWDYQEFPGYGTMATVGGIKILTGNAGLMHQEGVEFKAIETAGNVVYIAIDQEFAGYIIIADELKDDAVSTVHKLKLMGKKLVMLTGDSKIVGESVGSQLGISIVHSELLPAEKVEVLEKLETQKPTKGKILFVGDGINDAPVLARADIGVAMGGLGSDAAIEAADVVIMTDEPSKIVEAIKIARRTKSIVWQNIIFALGVKAIVLLLGAGGIASMWEAVFADVGVALIAVLNATRVLKS